MASGFVATPVLGRILATDGGPERDTWHALLAYTGLINQGFAKVHVAATAVALVLWSGAILRTGRLPRATAAGGGLLGIALLAGLCSGHLRLDVHGFGMVTAAQSAWLIWLGALLCRRPGPTG